MYQAVSSRTNKDGSRRPEKSRKGWMYQAVSSRTNKGGSRRPEKVVRGGCIKLYQVIFNQVIFDC